MRTREIGEDGRLDAVLDTHREFSRGGSHEQLFRSFAERAHQILRFDHFLDVLRDGLPEDSYRIVDRCTLPLGPSAPRPENMWDESGVPVERGGVVGKLARGERPRFTEGLDRSADPEVAGYRSCLTVPIFRNGTVQEWILLLSRMDSEPNAADVSFAVMACSYVSQAIIERKLLEEVGRLHGDLRAKIDELARVQKSVLPGAPPEVPGLTFAVSYAPCDAAGGDYYDFRVFSEGNVGTVIADVSGHGPAASVVMAMLRTVMGAYRRFGRPVGSVVGDVNDVLLESLEHGMFVTAFFCSIDPRSGAGFYANCGHNPPRIRRADGRVEALDGGASPPLGILPELQGEGDTFELSPGDTLVLYTDGITEAFDAERQMFGEDGLDAVLTRAEGTPEKILHAVTDAVTTHEGGCPRVDDQCVVVVRYEGPDASPD